MTRNVFYRIVLIAVFYFSMSATLTAQWVISEANAWAEIEYTKMNKEERIGQLFMVAAYSGGKNYNETLIKNLIANYHIGGLIFMQGTAAKQIELTNIYQKFSKTPLLIAMDAEWGVGMRLGNIKDFAKNIELGAANDDTLAYQLGKHIANQCKRLGVHVNFGPVVDVNNNPNNPVINFRSFGENKMKVANLGSYYMRGLQDQGVLACAKHFPGHGDTDVDSHQDLPKITKSITSLTNTEFYPFQRLITDGIQSVMVAHLNIPSITNSQSIPTTLSYDCITGILRNKMNFKGIVFTDALNMQGVAKYYKVGEVDLKAFLAGNDMLLFSQDVPSAVQMIKKALDKGEITEARLKESVVRILTAKYLTGARQVKFIPTANVDQDLNYEVDQFNTTAAQKALTLAKDENQLFTKKPSKNILYVAIGTPTIDLSELSRRQNISFMKLPMTTSKEILNRYLKTWDDKYDLVLVAVHGIYKYPKNNYGLDSKVQFMGDYLTSNGSNTALLLMGNPYSMQYFCGVKSAILTYEESTYTLNAALDFAQNKLSCKGTLPISICPQYKEGMGIRKSFKFSTQEFDIEELSLDDNSNTVKKKNDSTNKTIASSHNSSAYNFSEMEDLILNGLSKGAYPACQVLVAFKNKIVYHKSFGTQTSTSDVPVKNKDMFDIASITKIASTTLAIMKLYDQGKIDLDSTLGHYLPMTINTNKANLKIRDILLHQAGMQSWIPFYKNTIDSNNKPIESIYKTSMYGPYRIKVCNQLYMDTAYLDTMWNQILQSPIGPKSYVYSDLDFIFLQKVVETISHKSLDQFMNIYFYMPMNLTRIGFNPLQNQKKLYEIVPTEIDNYFRNKLVHGYVHDMGSAMMGGIAGHAGLFSNAYSLYALLNMLTNKGVHQGKNYLKPETINLFTRYQSSSSRRGLGFDKPSQSGKSSPTGNKCSNSTFGHQGFTGTCAWADPQNEIIFVFLSNRVYPTQNNHLLQSLDIRTKVQDEAYKALGI